MKYPFLSEVGLSDFIVWVGCAASGNVLKSEIYWDKVKFSEIKWTICKPIFYGGIPWCCDKKIPSCFESQRQCRLFKVSSFNILHQCTIPNYSLNCQIWKKEKNLSLFVISIQINQKQLKWSDNGRKKMAEHLCHITYLNDCLKWVAVTVQDIIPSVWLFIWSIRVPPVKWNYTLSGYKLDTTMV